MIESSFNIVNNLETRDTRLSAAAVAEASVSVSSDRCRPWMFCNRFFFLTWTAKLIFSLLLVLHNFCRQTSTSSTSWRQFVVTDVVGSFWFESASALFTPRFAVYSCIIRCNWSRLCCSFVWQYLWPIVMLMSSSLYLRLDTIWDWWHFHRLTY